MDTPTLAKKLVRDNLFLVFAEPNPETRLAAITNIWAPSSNSVFIDPAETIHGHENISKKVGELLEQAPANVFKERGSTQVLVSDTGDIVARIQWEFGSPGDASPITGEDIAIIVDGKIEKMYTFLNL